uniref:Uncharacterized protein n=1 Tax=Physcomitrium patens TaxID=3218 RepID=A0A2K1JE66_PHYPA|nr:hypothetical protein PHYPA_020068 [Physcomitrium patens]
MAKTAAAATRSRKISGLKRKYKYRTDAYLSTIRRGSQDGRGEEPANYT